MKTLLKIVALFISGLKTQSELAIENLALRQQLAIYKQKRRRPRLSNKDRLFWMWLSFTWERWRDALIIVKPETVIRWHRQGFKMYWRWKSKREKTGRPQTVPEIRQLIKRMAKENPTWGAPRVHGELLKLGFDLSEATVSRYMPKRKPDKDKIRKWKVFLKNHRAEIAAMDFFTVPTVSFRILYVLFVIEHGRRKLLHFNVTAHPTSEWVIQQLREAFSPGNSSKHLIFDRDSIFSREVVTSVKKFRVKAIRISYRSPWQNGVAERWVENCRRELLDHVIPFSEMHLRRLVRQYVEYYNKDRTHYGLDKETPGCRAIQKKPENKADVIALPRVGGLHHRYEWRNAG